ncbi:MAG: permease [Herbinix sp.]|jgi:putative ABC transport system permease protein|nr:permease [Herbinix sp.]
MVIHRKIKRTMMESKSQYLGSIALITLSCLLFTMFNLLALNLDGIIASFGENYVQEDANFMTDQELRNIAELEAQYNLRLEEGRTFDYAYQEDITLRLFSENTKVNIPAIIEGNELSGNDILIDPGFAAAHKLRIGDQIFIQEKAFLIAGFMSIPNYIYPVKNDSDLMTDPSHFGVAVLTKEDFSSIMKGNRFYQVKFIENQNGAGGSGLSQRIAEFKAVITSGGVKILGWMSATVNPRISFVTAKQSGISQISTVLPVAILLLTCILTGIVMWRTVKREAAIIGTLYALGYKKKEIMNHYLRYPVLIAIIGGIVGTILGTLTLRPMLNFMVTYFNMPVGTVDYQLKYMIISVLLPVAFLTVAGYLVVRKALRLTPLQLMRGGSEENKVGLLERHLKLDKFKFTTKFKIREQLRSVARSSFLLLGIIMATMLLLVGFAAKNSLDSVMQKGFNDAFQYEYSYVFNTIMQGEPAKGEPFLELPFALSSDDKIGITIYGVSPDSRFVTFKDRSGNPIDMNQVVITKALAEKLKVNLNDTISVVSKLDSKEYKIKVDKIAESYVGSYLYLPENYFNKMLGLPIGSYMGLWSDEKLDLPPEQLLAVVTKNEIKNAFTTMMAPIQSMIGVMGFMAFLIGLIVIYVVTSMMIEENKENISLMKILGYRKREVYSLILNSSSFSVILGYILGVPLLLASLNEMFRSLTKEMSISLPITISYRYLIAGFVIIYITYELTKALSKKKINRISMNEILKSRLE